MTIYSEGQLSITKGLIAQIVLACTYQQICNRKYEARGVRKDFATGSIGQGIAATSEPEEIPTLRLDISMPIDQQSGLLQKTNLAERIESITDIDLDNVSVGREIAYIRPNDFPTPSKPSFMIGQFDTLERRIIWMCLQLVNLKSWVTEWNQYYRIVLLHRLAYSNREAILLSKPSLIPFQPLIPSLAESILVVLIAQKTPYILSQSAVLLAEDRLEDYTLHLVGELSSPLEYHNLILLDDGYKFEIPISPDTSPLVAGSISDAGSEQAYVDSLTSSNDSAPDILDYNDFIRGAESSNIPDAPDDKEPLNTLPNC
jgi:hypothetical protein